MAGSHRCTWVSITGVPAAVADRIEPIGIEISTHLASVAGRTLAGRGGRCIHATGIDGLLVLTGVRTLYGMKPTP